MLRSQSAGRGEKAGALVTWQVDREALGGQAVYSGVEPGIVFLPEEITNGKVPSVPGESEGSRARPRVWVGHDEEFGFYS